MEARLRQLSVGEIMYCVLMISRQKLLKAEDATLVAAADAMADDIAADLAADNAADCAADTAATPAVAAAVAAAEDDDDDDNAGHGFDARASRDERKRCVNRPRPANYGAHIFRSDGTISPTTTTSTDTVNNTDTYIYTTSQPHHPATASSFINSESHQGHTTHITELHGTHHGTE